MTSIILTFDLEDADEDAYDAAYEALLKAGLSRLTENKKLRLPTTTVLGEVNIKGGAKAIGESLKTTIAAASGCKVTRILVAEVSSWWGSGDKDSDLQLKEILMQLGLLERLLAQSGE